MVQPLLLAWLLTIVFAATGVWFSVRCVQPGGVPGVADRGCDLAHAVMSAGMIAMVWPWGMNVPSRPQLVVFALATIWFVVLMVGGTRWAHNAHGNGRIPRLHHALMMAAMVWMLGMMPKSMPAGGGSSGHGAHHHGSASTTSDHAGSAGMSGTMLVISIVLGVFFLLASLGWISAAVDAGRAALAPAEADIDDAGPRTDNDAQGLRGIAFDAAGHGAMSVGMGAMLLAMV